MKIFVYQKIFRYIKASKNRVKWVVKRNFELGKYLRNEIKGRKFEMYEAKRGLS